MKARYSKDIDILMIQLSDKKIDDAYETNNMIVHVDEKGEPVLLEIFNGKKLVKDINKSLPKKIRDEVQQEPSVVAHRIR